MLVLSQEQLQKLSTKRLLAYKKKMHYKVFRACEDWVSYCTCSSCIGERKAKEFWTGLYNDIKSILATREHIERKKDDHKRISKKK